MAICPTCGSGHFQHRCRRQGDNELRRGGHDTAAVRSWTGQALRRRVRACRRGHQIASRYLRSRRGSKLLSLISIIAIGGVLVGVSALIVIIGVMNGLQKDLRDKILVASPDIRVLSYGEDLKITDWPSILA